MRLRKEKNKTLVVWLDKLQSMHNILTSQDESELLNQSDPFEVDFKKLRADIKDVRQLLEERSQLIQEAKHNYRADAEQMQYRSKINEKLKTVEQQQLTIKAQLDKAYEKFKKKRNKKSAKKDKKHKKIAN